MNGVNIFENRKADRLFYQISESLEGEKKDAFTREIKALFEKKITSEEGEYNCFKITEQDVASVFDNLSA